mmetsp:Transcript_63331/g.139320  ORF Transcript_63331/g.139320 Transcript_63331/m.139320 type:complete len:371 (+) Transcript_63331:362-1474(+)
MLTDTPSRRWAGEAFEVRHSRRLRRRAKQTERLRGLVAKWPFCSTQSSTVIQLRGNSSLPLPSPVPGGSGKSRDASWSCSLLLPSSFNLPAVRKASSSRILQKAAKTLRASAMVPHRTPSPMGLWRFFSKGGASSPRTSTLNPSRKCCVILASFRAGHQLLGVLVPACPRRCADAADSAQGSRPSVQPNSDIVDDVARVGVRHLRATEPCQCAGFAQVMTRRLGGTQRRTGEASGGHGTASREGAEAERARVSSGLIANSTSPVSCRKCTARCGGLSLAALPSAPLVTSLAGRIGNPPEDCGRCNSFGALPPDAGAPKGAPPSVWGRRLRPTDDWGRRLMGQAHPREPHGNGAWRAPPHTHTHELLSRSS